MIDESYKEDINEDNPLGMKGNRKVDLTGTRTLTLTLIQI